MKLCRICGKHKPRCDFYLSRGLPAGACKACRAVQTRDYKYLHPEVSKKACRKYAAKQTEEQKEERKRRQRELAKTRNRRLKEEAMTAYGGMVCSCCGEKIPEFLTIDHMNGDGGAHRRREGLKSSTSYYRWLKVRNYPPGFRVLCFNCNSGRQLNGGICPHTQKEETSGK